MRVLRQACGIVAATLIPLALVSCRETAGPTGTGRIAPTAAALAVVPVFGDGGPEPEIPLRQARIRLFRLPVTTPEVAALDALVPLSDRDEQAVTLEVTLTMANERFEVELALLDDRGDVAYLGRGTVVAYTSGKAPAAEPIRLVYAGPDTAVARIALDPRDTVIAVGEEFPIRAAAFLPDGRATSARFGFAVRGSPAVTVDASGVVIGRAPAGARTAWVVARTANGLTDSIAVEVRRRSTASAPSDDDPSASLQIGVTP
jgi:hypothetical protein